MMRLLLLLLTLLTLRLPAAAADWEPLFDGRTSEGWRGYRAAAFPSQGWKIEEGMLKKVGGVRGGDIVTTREFLDFEFSWEWRLSTNGNNGVKYLVTENRPNAPGHEYQMLHDAGHPDGKIGPKRQTAAFYDVLPASPDRKVLPPGAWNTSRILVQGKHVEHWLNGAKVLEYELGSETVQKALAASKFKNAPGFGEKIRGRLMLTDHGDECWFRNLRVRELK